MARTNRGRAIKDVCTLFEAGSLGRLTDGELLERFLAARSGHCGGLFCGDRRSSRTDGSASLQHGAAQRP